MPSTEMQQLKMIMKQMMEVGFAPKFDGSLDPYKLREVVQNAQTHMADEPGVEFIQETFGGIECELSLPECARTDAVVFYIHGGGLICGNAATSRGFASMLAGESRFPVWSCSYRLAPEHQYPAAQEDCFAVYEALLEKYPDVPIFLIGESAGAYLSLAVTIMARNRSVKLPAGIIPYSAPIEFSGVLDRDFAENEDFTVTPSGVQIMGQLYLTQADAGKPEAEPYYDDLHGFPPVLLSWDENESLSVDSIILEEKCKAAGVETEAYHHPHCFHAYATTGRGTPESYEILKKTVSFFQEHL